MTTGLASVDVQVAFDDDPLTITPTWTSVKTDTTDITITRGRNPDAPTYDTSSCAFVLDDHTGKYNPANTGGTYYGKLSSYRPVRVIANDSGNTSRTLFRGHVQPRGWKNTPQLPGTATTTVTALDLMQMCARYALATLDPPSDDETLKDRFSATIAQAGLASKEADWFRFLSPLIGAGPAVEPGCMMGPTTYGENFKTYLERLALTDGGAFWCNKDGLLTLEQRLYVFLASARNAAQFTFADDSTSISGGAIPFVTVVQDYARDIVNTARMAGLRGNVQEVSDGSIASFSGLANTEEHLDLLSRDDPEAYARAELLTLLNSDDVPGPVSLTFDAAQSAAAMDCAMKLELRDRVQVKYTPPNVGSQFTKDCYVEQITHQIPVESAPNTWTVTLLLSPCAPNDALTPSTFWIWGTSVWGTGRWAP